MRGAAAIDGSVPVGRRPVQQSRGDLTLNLVFLGNSIHAWDTSTLVSLWESAAGNLVSKWVTDGVQEWKTQGLCVGSECSAIRNLQVESCRLFWTVDPSQNTRTNCFKRLVWSAR